MIAPPLIPLMLGIIWAAWGIIADMLKNRNQPAPQLTEEQESKAALRELIDQHRQELDEWDEKFRAATGHLPYPKQTTVAGDYNQLMAPGLGDLFNASLANQQQRDYQQLANSQNIADQLKAQQQAYRDFWSLKNPFGPGGGPLGGGRQ